MPNIYINGTGSAQTGPSGSWGIGNDGNTYAQAQNISTPLASIGAADGIAGLTDGDVLVIFGTAAVPHTYSEASIQNFREITYKAEEAGYVTIDTGDGTRVIYARADTIVEGIIIDAGNTNDYAIQTQNLFGVEVIGGKLLNWNRQGILSQGTTALRGNLEIATTTASTNADIAGYKIELNANSETAIVESGVTVNIEHTAATGAVRGGRASATAALTGTSIVVEAGHTIDISTDNAAVSITHLLVGDTAGEHIQSVDIGAITTTSITSDPADSNVSGIVIDMDTVATIDKVYVDSCTISHSGNTPTTGIGLVIGNDDNAFTRGGLTITQFLCEGHSITNFWHGQMLGGVLGQAAERSTITDTNLSVLLKNCNGSKQNANVVVNPRSTAARFKSSTDCLIDNTTIYVDKDISANLVGLLAAKDDGFASSVDNRFTNNSIILAAGAKVYKAIWGDTDSVGLWTTENNNYYAVDGWATSATDTFATDHLTNYTFEQWQATQETSATEVDTAPANPPTDLAPTTGGNGGLLGSATGYSDFDNVIYPDPPPWGAYVLASTGSPTLTTPYSIDNPQAYGDNSYFYENRGRTISNITGYNFSSEFKDPFSVGDIMWARLNDGWATLRFTSATNVEVL